MSDSAIAMESTSRGVSFIHPTADVQSGEIGEGTSIWQHVVVLPGARIGRRCNICLNCFIENDVAIGNDVTVKTAAQLCDGVTVEDGAFIGPSVVFTNDRHPRSGNRDFKLERTVVKRGAAIGAGTVIIGGITIGEGAMVGAGSVVTRDVAPGEVLIQPRQEIRRPRNGEAR